jgi:hypothetical protein
VKWAEQAGLETNSDGVEQAERTTMSRLNEQTTNRLNLGLTHRANKQLNNERLNRLNRLVSGLCFRQAGSRLSVSRLNVWNRLRLEQAGTGRR